jgi:diguanylate cyclase (GGDEF)-like protein
MNLRPTLREPLSRQAQLAVWLLAIGLVGLVGYLHLQTGLGYEFHLFFIVPVVLVAWFVNVRRAHVIAVLAVILWYLADRQLGGESADRLPLLFNTLVRLSIFVAIVWLLGQLRLVLARESQLAREDALTGLANRRGFMQLGQGLLALARRQQTPISAIFIDLDHFKEVNDRFGHDTGDTLLQTVAATLRQHLRSSDVGGRLGGDEFALILPGTDVDAARAYAETLRDRLLVAMRKNGWSDVTFSIGVASFVQAPADLASLLKEADMLMYEVKDNGRDQVLVRRCPARDRP